jgi:hypothetical protein
MQIITTIALETVNGGVSKSSEITTALNGVTSALSSVKNQSSSSGFGSDPTSMMMLGLMMSQRNQGPTVVQAGAPAAPVVQGGPIINVSTRVRRGW